MPREVRLERLHPAEVRSAMADAAVAWLPLGAIEFHAEHLPFGTDGFTAQAVLERAARSTGGVVLPWSAVTLGTLHLPWTLRFDAHLVEGVLRQTIEQLAGHGARVVIVHTGHAPLDLLHLIKRVCADIEQDGRQGPDFRAYGLCYLELSAALGAGLGSDWPVAIDHGSITETSWLMAIEPELVHLERLPQDPEADGIVGVYGPNPRSRASAAIGAGQLDACAALLAGRARELLEGGHIDTMADLRGFVSRYWPEPLLLEGRAGPAGEAAMLLTNPAPVSRYLTSLALELDGETLGPDRLALLNRTLGEASAAVPVSALGPESGFYVRRGQTAALCLPDEGRPGVHRVAVELGLAGVTTTRLDAEVMFR